MVRQMKPAILMAVLLLALTACKKATESPIGSFDEYQAGDSSGFSSTKEIKGFYFKAATNSKLTTDYTGTISGTTITVQLANSTTRTALVPEFAFKGKSIQVGSTEQVSGSTANDFSSTLTYTLTAFDGTTTDYTASVYSGSPSSPSITLASGATSTSTKAVTVTLSAQDDDGVVGYYLSETNTAPLASASGWTTVTTTASYSGTASFTLSNSDATKTVYAWFKDSLGNVSDSANDTIALSLPKALSAFGFTTANNSSLKADATGSIAGTTVTVTARVPHHPTLTPTFTHSGTSVTVGGTAQTSGTSSQDFTSAVSYAVSDTDGGSASYSVSVTVSPPIPDTGQTTSYTTTSGEDNDYNTSNQPSYTDNGNSTVTDEVTGLIWQQCSAGLSGTNCATGTATTYTWANASSYCTNNTAGLTGSGWRLPTVTELAYLVRNEGSAPTINTTAFPAMVSHFYWSSTTYALDSTSAWIVYFGSGYVYSNVKTSYYYVRCVR